MQWLRDNAGVPRERNYWEGRLALHSLFTEDENVLNNLVPTWSLYEKKHLRPQQARYNVQYVKAGWDDMAQELILAKKKVRIEV